MNIVWTIAGSDSGGGAGIQADLNTFHDFDVHGCSAITALTAQNTSGVSHIQAATLENLQAQLIALKNDLQPRAIKLGMLYQPELIACVAKQLNGLDVPVIADPVLVSSSQHALYSDDLIAHYQKYIFPLASLMTPNVHEAQALTGIVIQSYDDMEKAAQALLASGAQAVLVKGGDLDSDLASDYFADHTQSFWLNQYRIDSSHNHGTGCTLSAAIAANIARGWSLIDAIIIAKAYVHAGLSQPRHVGSGRAPVGHVAADQLKQHFPWITTKPQALPAPFKKITQPIGRYPIVDNIKDLEILCSKGISFIQLRIKNPGSDFADICTKAQEVAKKFAVELIINDHLLSTGAHLGQEDLAAIDLRTLNRETMVLGLSAHNLFELAKAYAHHPSYLAMGPIFKTDSKKLEYPEIGLEKLQFIASLAPLPLVAIGGIAYEQMPDILKYCSGVAFIGAAKELIADGRFDRHFALPNFTLEHQQRLAQANIVCVGTGGLAAGFLPYLAAAGVGSITLIDHDKVSYSNLQRQVLFQENDLGKFKATVAAKVLSGLNSHAKITAYTTKLSIDNAIALLQNHDLIIDGTDNYDSHYLINDIARHLNIRLVAASVFQDQGQLFYLSPQSACYRCLFPEPPTVGERPNCSEAGVLGTTPAMLGIMQAQLALSLLSTDDHQTQSFCRTVDTIDWQINTFNLTSDPHCKICQKPSLNTLRSNHMSTRIEDISVEELKAAMESGHPINLLDVREDHEREEYNIGGVHIPIQELPERIYELDSTLPYVVYCYSGGRSSMACQFLIGQGFKVKNLAGGMKAWKHLT